MNKRAEIGGGSEKHTFDPDMGVSFPRQKRKGERGNQLKGDHG